MGVARCHLEARGVAWKVASLSLARSTWPRARAAKGTCREPDWALQSLQWHTST